MRKIILIFLIIFSATKSYADDLGFTGAVNDDESKTIRELQENIEELDKNKEEIIIKSLDFSPDSTLKSYFKDDLSEEELDLLDKIINSYNRDKDRLEEDLLEKSIDLEEQEDVIELKTRLLEVKKNLYVDMTPLIKVEHYQEYLDYIKEDISLYSEKIGIDSDILRKQEILNNKVEVLEERIKRHKSYLEDNLRKLVEKKLEEKINELSENPGFASLSNENKVKVLNKTILKIENRIESLNNLDNTLYGESSNEKKIEIYNITLEKLIEFMKTFEDQEEVLDETNIQ